MAPLLIPLAMELAKFVPSIVTMMSGNEKAGEVAGKVIDIARTVTGLEEPEAAVAAIAADPGKMLEFQEAMAAQKIDLEKAYLADIDSARKMQIAALEQDDFFSKRFVYLFATGWSVFAMVYFLCITFVPLRPEGQRVADTIMGVLIGTVLVGIFNFLFGSTNTSRVKDATISNLAK